MPKMLLLGKVQQQQQPICACRRRRHHSRYHHRRHRQSSSELFTINFSSSLLSPPSFTPSSSSSSSSSLFSFPLNEKVEKDSHRKHHEKRSQTKAVAEIEKFFVSSLSRVYSMFILLLRTYRIGDRVIQIFSFLLEERNLAYSSS